jgi:hypothetical protein
MKRDRGFAGRICDCGRLKGEYTHHCRSCETARRRGPLHWCEWCGAAFWRPKNDAKSDARRFCSKRCSGAKRTAAALIRRAISAEAAKKTRDADYARRLEQRRARRIEVDARGLEQQDARRIEVKKTWPDHVCPNCGAQFVGPKHKTFCGARCAHQLRKPRFPRFGSLPIEARNNLAELMALVRAANRRLQGHDDDRRTESADI